MPTATKRGSSEPLLQWWDTRYSLSQGPLSNMEYKGIDLTKMSVKASQLAQQGWDGTLRFEHDVATLTCTKAVSLLGNGQSTPFSDITDKWEVGVDQEKPELFENPNFIASCNQYDSTYFKMSEQIFQCLRSVASSGNASWSDFCKLAKATFVTNIYGVPTTTKVLDVLTLISTNYPSAWEQFGYLAFDYLRGRTNFLRGKYVLRHTTMAPSNYASNVADFNVEKIYSIAGLLSEAQNGGLWILPLPGYLAYKILAYPIPVTMPPNYMWGALKTRSSAVTAAQGRIEISTEYLIDACPIHTYGLAS